MRLHLRVGLLALTLLTQTSFAANLDLSGLENWKMGKISPGSPEAEFTEGAIAILTLGEGETGPRATVLVKSRAEPAALILNNNTIAWNHFFLHRKPTKNESFPHKINIMKELVFRQQGQWRYFLEFQTNTGGPTPLNTAILALEMDGEVQYLLYEDGRAAFLANIGEIEKLFHHIGFGEPK